MKSIAIEIPKTRMADEVCAGIMTIQASTMGRNIGSPPSRQMRRCLAFLRQVQNFRLGTICIVAIDD